MLGHVHEIMDRRVFLLVFMTFHVASAQNYPANIYPNGLRCKRSSLESYSACSFTTMNECLGTMAATYDFRISGITLEPGESISYSIACPTGYLFPTSVGGGELRGNVVVVQNLLNNPPTVPETVSVTLRNIASTAISTTPHLYMTCTVQL